METVAHQEDIVADASLLSEECPVNDDGDGIDSGQIESTPQRIVSVLFTTEEILVSGNQKHALNINARRSNDVHLHSPAKHTLQSR